MPSIRYSSGFIPLRDGVLSHRLRLIGFLFQLPLQPIQLLVQLHLESRQTQSIDASTAPVRFHPPQAISRFFRLYTLSINEWTFFAPVRLIQSTSLLRRERTGFSLMELFHLSRLYSSGFFSLPDRLRLLSFPTLPSPISRSPSFRHASSTIQPSDD
jgi:hypothetical protein